MMPRSLCTLLLCFLFFSVTAQDEDSLYVTVKNKSWVMPYTTNGETIFMVARRFHVPPPVLGSVNNIDYKSNFLPARTHLTVPIAAYNFMREKPNDMMDALPLYYIVKEDDDLLRISRLSGVSQQVMERWNSLPDNNIYIGQSLFIGWVLYDATSGNKHIVTNIDDPQNRNNIPAQNKNGIKQDNTRRQNANPESQWPGMQQKEDAPPVSRAQKVDDWADQPDPAPWRDTVIVIRRKDTVAAPPLLELYLSQTANEVNVAMEKGSVAFFNSGNKSADVYYAFHKELPRGVVIKVHNPGTDKTVYAKVIGPLPATKQYYNCIMALSGNAKDDLGVKEDKAWFEISHR